MRIFLDTEFIEDGKTIDLISIGMVREDGKTYYAISTEFKKRKASQWVKNNVLSHLPPRHANPMYDGPNRFEQSRAWKPRKQIAQEIVEFCGDAPEFWGYYCDYDWVVLCQLYGTMMELPKSWPYYCRDLHQLLDHMGRQHIKQPEDAPHHALSDARWIKETWGSNS